MRLKITTFLEMDDDISGEAIEDVRADFEDVAFEHNMIGSPTVLVEEVT